jgi:hypothetical protein
MATTLRAPTSLSSLERVLLLVPLVGGLFFGLFPLIDPPGFAGLVGLNPHDPFIYRLFGAAILGYPAALIYAITAGTWRAARLPVLASLGFNLASLYACGAVIAAGERQTIIYLVVIVSIVIVLIAAWLLVAHRAAPRAAHEIPSWMFWFLVLATLLSIPFALLPLFVPDTFVSLFALPATDAFVLRGGGAAIFGYAVLGLFELQSRSWSEIFSAALMVLTFDGLVAVVCALVLLHMLSDPGGTLAPLALAAGGFVALATVVEIARRGK